MKRLVVILLLVIQFLLFGFNLNAQTYVPELDGWLMNAVVVNGDTLPYTVLPEVVVFSKRKYQTQKDQTRYTRLVNNVTKVYPFARIAREKLDYYENLIVQNPAKKDSLMKRAEKEIEKELKPQLKELTYSQGHILLKLIDRETGKTSYRLVRELRSRTRAGFYQFFAGFFGFNLKKQYNPSGEDYEIEQIVRYLEAKEKSRNQGKEVQKIE
ncbi:MAG: DUF4294 domain-containing protein [Bacteroidales bacterium]|jgi:hypothetical protein|nr:DUF4294 domain-containing protein [Bacteroidales bacterium]